MTSRTITVYLENENATKLLGEDLALALGKRSLIYLTGDLGMGKSTFARAFIRAACDDLDLDVPSPTFTLAQTYHGNSATGLIAHFDLYRLEDGFEAEELGIDDALETGIALIEWPERGSGFIPDFDLEIEFAETGPVARSAKLSGNSPVMERIERSLAIRKFLSENWSPAVTRRYMLGDASTRTYETAEFNGHKRILMNAPPMADGPIMANGKPYSQIAHLAEDVRPYVAITHLLRERGFEAPEIYAEDLDNGFLIIDHFGHEGVLDDKGTPDASKYLAAVKVLAQMHSHNWPEKVPVGEIGTHIIPTYDLDAMMIEVDLLAKWYVPRFTGKPLNDDALKEFEAIWRELIKHLADAEKTLVLRDYHSPNLLWLAENEPDHRIGLIDFQDAMIGPSAYDVASLAQDARVIIPQKLEQNLLNRYLQERCAFQADFDRDGFLEAYAIMAAQRATKVLGIFVRLDERDRKPAYLAHIPHMQTYLKHSLKHPILAKLKSWLNTNAGF